MTLQRLFLQLLSLAAIGAISLSRVTAAPQLTDFQKKIAALETTADGRIGLCAVDTSTYQSLSYRGEELFPTFCTIKVIIVGAILKQSMSHPELMQERILFTKKELDPWSPVTQKHLANGLTISELCAAAIMYSDNTAMNLLIQKLGGLTAILDFAHAVDAPSCKADAAKLVLYPKYEPFVATPADMERSLQQLTLGPILGAPQRDQLITWMKLTTTGNHRIRAGAPSCWAVADKTGSGINYGITNDIGLLWPIEEPPVVLAIYFMGNKSAALRREDIVASVTTLVAEEFGKIKTAEQKK